METGKMDTTTPTVIAATTQLAIPFDNQNSTNNLVPIFNAFFQALSTSLFSNAGSASLQSALLNNNQSKQCNFK